MHTAVTRSPTSLLRAFSATDNAAFGLISVAITLSEPERAAAMARMPVPVPMSTTAFREGPIRR
jgi:hypothetical protein